MIRPARSIRASLAAFAVAAVALTACGASAPPAKELAIEVIDSMVLKGEITEERAACMREKVNAYEGEALDQIADRADSGNAEAIADLEQFQADLASCPGG